MKPLLRFLYNKFVKPVFTINDTPHSIALGVSLGMFIALTPTVSVQMILVVIIGTLIRANRLIGVILIWISNPVTVLPLYYAYYWLGGKLLGVEIWTFGNFEENMDQFWIDKERLGYLTTLKQLGGETLGPLLVGSLVIATVVALPLYPITLYALLNRKEKRDLARKAKEDSGKPAPPKEGSSSAESNTLPGKGNTTAEKGAEQQSSPQQTPCVSKAEKTTVSDPPIRRTV